MIQFLDISSCFPVEESTGAAGCRVPCPCFPSFLLVFLFLGEMSMSLAREQATPASPHVLALSDVPLCLGAGTGMPTCSGAAVQVLVL